MSITVNIRYTGTGGNARRFAEEMISGGTVAAIRAEAGNIKYDYYVPALENDELLLLEKWQDSDALQKHGKQARMEKLAAICAERVLVSAYSPLKS